MVSEDALMNEIDITHDFYEYYEKNIDPDKYSKVLRKWHKILWEKYLPDNKNILNLVEKDYGLFHKSNLGEYYLTSDSIIHTYSRRKSFSDIVNKFPIEEINNFRHIASKIGGYILFPGYKINNAQTINGARGFNVKIADRFDLTLECIRLYYLGENDKLINPLGDVLNRYDNYFKLFLDFKGYCNFFLLQDLTYDNFTKIKYFLPFTGFTSKPLPSSVDEYGIYKNNCIDFVNSRNNRIIEYIRGNTK